MELEYHNLKLIVTLTSMHGKCKWLVTVECRGAEQVPVKRQKHSILNMENEQKGPDKIQNSLGVGRILKTKTAD